MYIFDKKNELVFTRIQSLIRIRIKMKWIRNIDKYYMKISNRQSPEVTEGKKKKKWFSSF